MTRFLFDTSIVFLLGRGGPFAEYILERFSLANSPSESLHVSVVTHGELRALVLKNKWGSKKISFLEDMLSYLATVQLSDDVITSYAQIDLYSHASGRKMGKNDLWIAASARVADATLITADKDFDHLSDLLKVEYVDQKIFH